MNRIVVGCGGHHQITRRAFLSQHRNNKYLIIQQPYFHTFSTARITSKTTTSEKLSHEEVDNEDTTTTDNKNENENVTDSKPKKTSVYEADGYDAPSIVSSLRSAFQKTEISPSERLKAQQQGGPGVIRRSSRSVMNIFAYFSQNYYLFALAVIAFALFYMVDPVAFRNEQRNLSARAKREEREIE